MRVVKAAELQDKADRCCVRESRALPAGVLHVSPLDLNVESGQAEMPQPPVVRLATPVAGAQGATLGMVILNLRAQVLDRSQARPWP